MKRSRAEVVQAFLDLYPSPSYLEVGVARGDTFHTLKAARKVAVDPRFLFDVAEAEIAHPESTFAQVTSDSYFGSAGDETFDVIYLDGLHTLEQTLRDFTNALERIRPTGVIVIDDVFPNSNFAAMADFAEFRRLRAAGIVKRGSWMGDVYRLVYMIETFFQSVSFRTTAENHGQLVVWKAQRPAVPERSVEEVARLTYEQVLTDNQVFRRQSLDEIVADVRAWLGDPVAS
jgi:hypothetical protein